MAELKLTIDANKALRDRVEVRTAERDAALSPTYERCWIGRTPNGSLAVLATRTTHRRRPGPSLMVWTNSKQVQRRPRIWTASPFAA
jgi:hypothetical protein